MVANNPYTRQYDLDVYFEIKTDSIAEHICLLGEGIEEGFIFKIGEKLHDAYLTLPMLAFGQVISLNASVNLNNTPDTPSASGTVNRVVKGVTIHPL
jgi:tagatose-6-phosphate ketose/aldose isomerase